MSGGSSARDDRAFWEARYAQREPDADDRAPSEWVVRQCLALPRDAIILDVAGGTGRHAAPLASRGRTVVVVDFIPRAVRAARLRHQAVLATVADVAQLPIRDASVHAVICVNFLDRTIFEALARVLRPGGALVYETFTRHHLKLVESGRAHGPRTTAFLLADGELRGLVEPLTVLDYAEGLVVDDAGERHVARVVAVKEELGGRVPSARL
jgi:SAM-dependent methyltransferase